MLFDILSHQQEAVQNIVHGAPTGTNDSEIDLAQLRVDFDDIIAANPIEAPPPAEHAPAAVPAIPITEFLASIGPTVHRAIPLTATGLDELAERFVQEEVTLETLLACTDADYKDLCVTLGKKKKITAGERYSCRMSHPTRGSSGCVPAQGGGTAARPAAGGGMSLHTLAIVPHPRQLTEAIAHQSTALQQRIAQRAAELQAVGSALPCASPIPTSLLRR